MGLKLAGIMGMLMIALASSFYWYYNDSQKRMAIMIENQAKMEIAVKTSEEAVQSLRQNIASVNAELTRVNTEFSAAREQNRQLASRLAEHEIGQLAVQKPALVQRVINGASTKAMRCFELLSGAELTEAEKNATDAKSFNSECPWLWNGPSTP